MERARGWSLQGYYQSSGAEFDRRSESQASGDADGTLEDIKPLEDKLFSKKGDLRLLWQEKNLDQAKITALDKEIRVLRDQIHEKRTSYQWAVYKLLTPEQREQFKGFGPGGPCFGPGMGHGMGHGDGSGHGPGMMMGPGAGRMGNE